MFRRVAYRALLQNTQKNWYTHTTRTHGKQKIHSKSKRRTHDNRAMYEYIYIYILAFINHWVIAQLDRNTKCTEANDQLLFYGLCSWDIIRKYILDGDGTQWFKVQKKEEEILDKRFASQSHHHHHQLTTLDHWAEVVCVFVVTRVSHNETRVA